MFPYPSVEFNLATPKFTYIKYLTQNELFYQGATLYFVYAQQITI